MYIVGFNGPPESGKDSLAEGLMAKIEDLHNVPVKFESLSMTLREVAYSVAGWRGEIDGPNYEAFKRETLNTLGITGRQLMIDVSEKFLKPCYGESIMAKLLMRRNKGFEGILLVRDCGFQIEVDPLIQWAGAENFYIARCHRPGKNFANDSREYVYHTHPRVTGQEKVIDYDGDYYNESTEFDWKTAEAARLYGVLVSQLGWKL